MHEGSGLGVSWWRRSALDLLATAVPLSALAIACAAAAALPEPRAWATAWEEADAEDWSRFLRPAAAMGTQGDWASNPCMRRSWAASSWLAATFTHSL